MPQKVGIACGLCNARANYERPRGVHLREAPQDPDEERRMGPEHGEISCNRHHQEKGAKLCMHTTAKLTSPREKGTQETQNKDHGDHIAQKGFHSWWVLGKLVQKPIPYSRHKIPEAKAAVHREWSKQAWQESQEKGELQVIDEARRESQTFWILQRSWIHIISKIQTWKRHFQDTEALSYHVEML